MLVNYTSPFFVCDDRGHGVLRRWAVWQRQQWLLELGPRQCQPSPFSIGHQDGQEPGPTDRWRTAHGAGPSRMWGAGGQEVQGENEKTVRLQNLRVTRQRFKNTTESHFVLISHSQSLSRGAYRCLWPGCGKVLTSRVGMKRHIRILHLGWVCLHTPNSWNNWDGSGMLWSIFKQCQCLC